MSVIKDTKAYSINDFINWFDNDELSLSPKYQRNAVWNNNAKSYLMDTILRGYPIPQIFLRQIIDVNTRKTTREIIDGQQRLRSIIEFTQDSYSISKSHNNDLGGKFYSDLDDDLKEAFLSFNISTEIIKLKEDSKIYEMFARLNTNNMALNRQELRNAKYWGEFKVYIYKKTTELRDFLITNKVFKDKEFARMNDVEFINTISILLLDGIITETPTKIDSYYKKYDIAFNSLSVNESRLDYIFYILNKIFDNPIFQTKIFHRKGYLYSLISFLSQQFYSELNDSILKYKEYSTENIDENLSKLVNSLMEFESNFLQITNSKEKLEDDSNYVDYFILEKNHKTRTTSVAERIERVSILSKYLNPNN